MGEIKVRGVVGGRKIGVRAGGFGDGVAGGGGRGVGRNSGGMMGWR